MPCSNIHRDRKFVGGCQGLRGPKGGGAFFGGGENILELEFHNFVNMLKLKNCINDEFFIYELFFIVQFLSDV